MAISVWGCCFIHGIGTPRPENRIRHNTISTSFLYLNFNASIGDCRSKQIHLTMKREKLLVCLFIFAYLASNATTFDTSFKEGKVYNIQLFGYLEKIGDKYQDETAQLYLNLKTKDCAPNKRFITEFSISTIAGSILYTWFPKQDSSCIKTELTQSKMSVFRTLPLIKELKYTVTNAKFIHGPKSYNSDLSLSFDAIDIHSGNEDYKEILRCNKGNVYERWKSFLQIFIKSATLKDLIIRINSIFFLDAQGREIESISIGNSQFDNNVFQSFLDVIHSGFKDGNTNNNPIVTNTKPTKKINTNAPSAIIEKAWLEHGVSKYGYNGMNIHMNFVVNNMKNREGEIAVLFYYSDGRNLMDKDGECRMATGQVAMPDIYTPRYDSSRYDDFVIFMPAYQLHESNKSLKCQIWIGDGINDEPLAKSEYLYFDVK